MSIGRMLVVAGLVLLAVGLVIVVAERLGLGRLPGDLVFRRKGVTISFPIASSILVSILLTIVLHLIARK